MTDLADATGIRRALSGVDCAFYIVPIGLTHEAGTGTAFVAAAVESGVPVMAIGGEKGLGAKVGEAVSLVATNVEATVEANCGHFVPEEAPHAIIDRILEMAARTRI